MTFVIVCASFVILIQSKVLFPSGLTVKKRFQMITKYNKQTLFTTSIMDRQLLRQKLVE